MFCWYSGAFKLSQNLLVQLGVGKAVEIIGLALRFLCHGKVLSIRRQQDIINFAKVSHDMICSHGLINESILTCLAGRVRRKQWLMTSLLLHIIEQLHPLMGSTDSYLNFMTLP